MRSLPLRLWGAWLRAEYKEAGAPPEHAEGSSWQRYVKDHYPELREEPEYTWCEDEMQRINVAVFELMGFRPTLAWALLWQYRDRRSVNKKVLRDAQRALQNHL